MKTRTLLAFLFFTSLAVSAAPLTPVDLRCEYLTDPMGIDETTPRLSWQVTSEQRGESQTAWQVLVADSEKALSYDIGDLWDSGTVSGDETTANVYKGEALTSEQRCYWKVRVWDRDGKASDWSKPAAWSMGLLNQSDWKGDWIGYDKFRAEKKMPAEFASGAKWVCFGGDAFPDCPKALRDYSSELKIPQNARVAQAELLIVSGGRARFSINGEPVELAHGTKDTGRLVDVFKFVQPGANSLRAEVDNQKQGPSGLIAQLTVTTDDGHTYTAVTDESWQARDKVSTDWKTCAIVPADWSAVHVIGPAGCEPWGALTYTPLYLPPASYLRKEFAVPKKVRRATLYGTALGLVDFHINGHLVSEDRFTPGWTDYHKRVPCRTSDVTKLLRDGKNVWGAILADGWYSGYVAWGRERDNYGKKPRVRAQLQIDYTDGSSDTIVSGSDWKASSGPITSADFLMGESYDARAEQKWDAPEFDDGKWDAVAIGAEMEPLIQAHPGPPVRVFAEVKAESVKQVGPDTYVFDMGQNFAGVVRLKVHGEPGQEITLRFAERLNPDGTAYTFNLRGALATDTYICRGGGTETWEPRFTYHGFQYVEITGLKTKPGKNTVIGLALSSATADTGKFECSDPMLNRLERNTYWTQRANFIDVPTDCPQRDERLGWMGDAQVYVRTATLHEDVQAFFTKWLVDVDDAQGADGEFSKVSPLKAGEDDGGPAWADAGVICPWTIYEVYGDTRELARHYDSMARYIDFCKIRSTPDLLPPKKFHCYGDWLNINDDTPKTVIYTAYFAYSTELMAQMAAALGKADDAAKYNDLFNGIKAAFNKAYVHADGRIEGDTQADYVLAISFGLLDGDRQKQAAQHLVENIEKRGWHLSTGFVGTKSLMLALAQIGRNDVAWRLIHNDTFPSWGFSIKNGATSIWERWDGWTPDKGFQDAAMNSFAHYSFGAVYQWIVENIGGIQTDGPAYKHIIIAPQPDDKVTFADTTYDSIHGPIETHWKKSGSHFTLKVVIPANTTATVLVPTTKDSPVLADGQPVENASGVTFLRKEDNATVFEVTSGTYNFETE
jgi:alpha-L-rhamnosidase